MLSKKDKQKMRRRRAFEDKYLPNFFKKKQKGGGVFYDDGTTCISRLSDRENSSAKWSLRKTVKKWVGEDKGVGFFIFRS